MNKPGYTLRSTVLMALGVMALGGTAEAARVKELVEVEGFRTNALVGIGLVTGLQGTGDDSSAIFNQTPIATLLRHLGIVVTPTDIRTRNIALVTVTANLPPFAQPGMTIDVTVSSMGTARSLSGGTLISTPLKGADKQIYALAQGSLILGGFSVGGASGTSAAKNHVTTAHIPSGGMIEREAPAAMPGKDVVLLLREPDYTTAQRIVDAINAVLGKDASHVRDPAAVVLPIGDKWKDKVVQLVSQVEAVEAMPDTRGRVVVDEHTGTVIIGANVTLGPAAIAYGGLSINVSEKKQVSQPRAFGKGKTEVVPETEVKVEEKMAAVHVMGQSGTVGDVAAALNALGIKPRDLVAIFQALKAAGALRAEIQVM